jgi:uncharacterized protein
MNFQNLLSNLAHPPILFFAIGLLAVVVKSDLKVPDQIAKFFTLYLLFDIGFKGGVELAAHGLTEDVLKIVAACMIFSAGVPFIAFHILKRKISIENAGAIAATYGSVSAVTFATAVAFMDTMHIQFGGYMVACMALMESPAIVSGLLLIRIYSAKKTKANLENGVFVNAEVGNSTIHQPTILDSFKEAMVNGSVFLMLGSMVVGYLTGHEGHAELKPFVNDIYKGMLSLYMLDMGIVAANRLKELKQSGIFLTTFALLYPLIAGSLAILVAYFLHLSQGDALLFTVLCASASYIAVPAAMRMAVPTANMSLLLPMSLGVTFMFNVLIGIPLYYNVIKLFWV